MVKLVLSQLFVIAVLFSSCNTIASKREPIIAGFPDAALARVFAEGIISTGDYETHAAFTPGGDTVYFLKCMPDLSTCAICSSYKNDGQWGKPEIVSFSGKYLDVDPFVTSDGNTFYFVSNRPYKAGDTLNASWDIWKCDKKGNDWGEPVHLDSIVNSTADEYYPTVSDKGSLYFGSSREGGRGGSDIYRAKAVNGKFMQVENLGDSINTSDNEYEAFIAPDESYLIFMATVPKGLSNADFFWTRAANNGWTKAKKLTGDVNSPATEWAPKVTRDGRYFYFGSTRNRLTALPSTTGNLNQFQKKLQLSGNGLGDIYYINFSSLSLQKDSQ